MREEKDIHPIDKLFQQSLEGYAPAPPPSAWKAIRKKVKPPKPGFAKWFGNHAGILIGSVSALVIITALLLTNDEFNTKEKALIQQDSAIAIKPFIKTHAKEDSADNANTSTIPTPDFSKTTSDTKTQILSGSAKNDIHATPATAVLNVNSQSSTNVTKPEQSISLIATGDSQPDADIKDKPSTSDRMQPDNNKEESQNNDLQLQQPESPGDANNTTSTTPHQGNKLTIAEDTISPSNPKTEDKPTSTDSKTQNALNKTIIWQTGFWGNSGLIWQQQRETNLMYGAIGTIGLWHSNLKAGIETGIGMQAYKDKGALKNTYRIYDTLIVVDTVWHQDSGFVYSEIITNYLPFSKDTNQIVNFNHTYLYLQFPLLFTKQILALKKLTFDIKAGPILGLQISKNTSRKIVETPEGGVLIKTENTNYTRLQTHWQILISPQIKYDLSKNTVLSVSPGLTLFPDKLYSADNRPKSNPYGISVYGGIIYKLK